MKKKQTKKKYIKPVIKKSKLFNELFNFIEYGQDDYKIVHWDGTTWGT